MSATNSVSFTHEWTFTTNEIKRIGQLNIFDGKSVSILYVVRKEGTKFIETKDLSVAIRKYNSI